MKRRPTNVAKRFLWNRWFLLLIIAIVGVSLWVMSSSGSSVLHPKQDKSDLGLRLGLDLKGGVQLVYQADYSQIPDSETWDAEQRSTAVSGAVKTIESRVNGLGVLEPIIQRQGSDRVLVELPGISDVEQAKSVIEATAFLEFREVELNGSSVATLGDYLSGNRTIYFDTSVSGSRIFYSSSSQDPVAILTISDNGSVSYTDKDGNSLDTTTLTASASQSWMPATGTLNGVQTQLIGPGYLKSAKNNATTTSTTSGVKWVVDIDFSSDGWDLFNQIAKRLYGKTSPQNELGIVLDKALISAPTMNASSYTTADIEGSFTSSSSHQLAVELTSGALPVPLKTLYESQISGTLGGHFVHKAYKAGLVAFLIVALFMILYYRLPGVVATVALAIYVLIVLAIYKLIPVTMSLAGIAGFVVSMGMAVDANVLIFERMKEELRAGRTLGSALDAGFSRAWPSIRDSNISTFITCAILYWFGGHIVTNPTVKGFALTLFIGVAVSMFSAIMISRTLLFTFLTGPWAARHLNWFGVETKPMAGTEDV